MNLVANAIMLQNVVDMTEIQKLSKTWSLKAIQSPINTSPASAPTHGSTYDDLAGTFWKWNNCLFR